MSLGTTTLARLAKKDGGRAGKVLVAMGVKLIEVKKFTTN